MIGKLTMVNSPVICVDAFTNTSTICIVTRSMSAAKNPSSGVPSVLIKPSRGLRFKVIWFIDIHNLSLHICDNCGKQYKWDTSLMRHKRLECGKSPQFACHICDYKTKHNNSLKKHLANRIGSLDCLDLKVDSTCHLLSKTEVQGNDEANDDRGEVFKCDSCSRSYRWVKSLLRHKRLECGKLPQFGCDFCDYRTKHRSSLIKHTALKHGMLQKN
ncbi:zinc finger protein 729-like [Macrosteles quadrilineatus]|uniref:zinc finger protein 729-like n=1 Tax=Macrosteles quadrilineatus TaxID=74068 RepID=UPI0023E2FA9B|nr:zinc finger protein 729-like [Macrosteles quadrilineatus]